MDLSCAAAGGNQQVIFQPVPYTVALHVWALEFVGLPRDSGFHVTNDDSWAPQLFRHNVSLWTPPPELARRAITTFLHSWVQSPRDTSAIFLIPRILQRRWGRVCRYIREVGTFLPHQLPRPVAYSSLLPFVFLHIPPFVPALSPPRMELSSKANQPNWHRRQAEEVRGLS